MTPTEFNDIIRTNPTNCEILDRLPQLNVPDTWLVSGALFQTAWNHQTGRAPAYGIKDYDVLYLDAEDLSWEGEDKVIKRAERLFQDVPAEVEIRNQARVHLWYEKKFAMPYPALKSCKAAIDRFLSPACMVGLRSDGTETGELYAPYGLNDIEHMIVRPNPSANFNWDRFMDKARRWQSAWPEIRIETAPPQERSTA